MGETERGGGRRAYDSTIDPAVQVFVEKTVGDTRHLLHGEIATVAVAVADAKILATQEHGEVRGELRALRQDIREVKDKVAELAPLRDKVTDLERRDDIDHAVAKTLEKVSERLDANRRWLIGALIALIAMIAGAAGVIVAAVS